MMILKIIREENSLLIKDEVDGPHSKETREITYHDAPTGDFDNALQALKAVVKGVMELPESWVATVKVRGLELSYTKAGTMSVRVIYERPMAITDSTHRMKTPMAQADDPAEGEEQDRELSIEQAKLVYAILEEAEGYVGGKRQQQELPLSPKEKANTPEEDDPDLLQFKTPPAGGKGTPAKKKTAAKKTQSK